MTWKVILVDERTRECLTSGVGNDKTEAEFIALGKLAALYFRDMEHTYADCLRRVAGELDAGDFWPVDISNE